MMRDMSVLLAQDTVAIGDVFGYFVERLVTPAGIAALVLGLAGVGLALALRKGLPLLTWATLFSLTFMIHEATLTQNILIGPFQAYRALTRPISFALMSLGCSRSSACRNRSGAEPSALRAYRCTASNFSTPCSSCSSSIH